MTVRPAIYADREAVGRALAAGLADSITEGIAARGRFVLGCPGGRTPVSTYEALSDELARRKADVSGLVIAMMDDYVMATPDGWAHVPEDAHNSCVRFARVEIQAVLNRGLPESHRIPDAAVLLPDPADPAAYEALLDGFGGIDFFLLASGAGDGHVAFNPPGSDIDSVTRVVELAEQTRRDNLATFPDFAGLDEVPTHGVTVGIGTIRRVTKRGAMIAVGADKREAVRRLTDGAGYDASWPATVFRVMDGVGLFVDEAAAGERIDRVPGAEVR